MYDLIIIGAGPAGITAAIYAARAKLSFLVISMDIGGLTGWSPNIENYPGYHNVSGIELVDKFKEHLKDYNVKITEDSVNKVEKKGKNFLVETNSNSYETKTVIVCSGSSPRKLNVPGGDEFEGKGLAYCATCDGPLFEGKDVAVIGGGDSALAATLTLIPIASKIYLINTNPELGGTDVEKKNKALKSKKVKVLNNSKTKEILGKDSVSGLIYEQNGKEIKLNVEGVFVEIGHIRNISFVKGLVKLDEKDEIVVDKTGMTSVPGIFAAGDITDFPGKQVICAAGDGARAALSAFEYISKKH